MKTLTILLALPCLLFAALPFQAADPDAMSFASESVKSAMTCVKQISATDLVPEEDRSKTFNPDVAREQVLSDSPPTSELQQYLESELVLTNESRFFDRLEEKQLYREGDRIAAEVPSSPNTNLPSHRVERCLLADAPQTLRVTRSREVEIEHKPTVTQQCKACEGHAYSKGYWFMNSAQDAFEELQINLANDSSLQSWNVWIVPGKRGKSHKLEARWIHKPNTHACDHYTVYQQAIEPAHTEELDRWVVDHDHINALLRDPNATFIKRHQYDNEARTIDGVVVERPYWSEDLVFAYCPDSATCQWQYDPSCELVDKICQQEGPDGCCLWELTFNCFGREEIKVSADKPPEDDADPEATQPNNTFCDVVAKLAVFSDIKDQLEESDCLDATKVQLFPGKIFTCSKSVADDLLYDCCFATRGLADRMHLAQCTPDELHLADLRDQGRCHYVGHYSEKLFNALWKSRDVHVFCCFPSKLARVFQEQARTQLDIGWGKPKSPLPRGLYQEEIASLDMSAIDLSASYEPPPTQATERRNQFIDQTHERIKQRIQEELGHA